MSWIKKIPGGFSYVVFLVIFVALLLEVTYRVLPTSDSLMVKPVNAENPIMRFTENREQRSNKANWFQFQACKYKEY